MKGLFFQYLDGEFYVTVPRTTNGIPATMSKLSKEREGEWGGPLLQPYPSWEMNERGEGFSNTKLVRNNLIT